MMHVIISTLDYSGVIFPFYTLILCYLYLKLSNLIPGIENKILSLKLDIYDKNNLKIY